MSRALVDCLAVPHWALHPGEGHAEELGGRAAAAHKGTTVVCAEGGGGGSAGGGHGGLGTLVPAEGERGTGTRLTGLPSKFAQCIAWHTTCKL